MSGPPAVFVRAQAAFASLAQANGLVRVHSEYDERAFGSAYEEFRGPAGALQLVWDGKEAMLFANLLKGEQWLDVETLLAGRPLQVNLDQSDERIAQVVEAAAAALALHGRR